MEGFSHHAGLLLTIVHNQVLAKEMFAALLLEALLDGGLANEIQITHYPDYNFHLVLFTILTFFVIYHLMSCSLNLATIPQLFFVLPIPAPIPNIRDIRLNSPSSTLHFTLWYFCLIFKVTQNTKEEVIR